MGLEATNDKLVETVFGTYDMVLRRIQGISMEAASAVAQAIRAKSFAPGGYADLLPRKELEALIEWARMHVREHRAVDRADHRELDEYHARRRKTNSEMELDALIKVRCCRHVHASHYIRSLTPHFALRSMRWR